MSDLDSNPMEAILSPEQLTISQRFEKFTGIKPLETPEATELRGKFVARAVDYARGFVDKGLISPEKFNEIRVAWEQAIVLDPDGQIEYGKFLTYYYEDALRAFDEFDPDHNDEKVGAMRKNANNIIKTYLDTNANALATVSEAQPWELENAKLMEMPDRWIIINSVNMQKHIEDPITVSFVACEETGHLLSNLDKYSGELHNSKWVEEMMSRVVAMTWPTGHSREDETMQHAIGDKLRFKDYFRLYTMIHKQAGVSEDELILYYFGHKEVNDQTLTAINNAIKELDFIATIVDMGFTMEALQKEIENRKEE
jgi:hypothetical protein